MRGNRNARGRRRSALLGALAALTALLCAAGVGTAAENITAKPNSFEYSKAVFTSNEGERPLYVGSGTDFHNVTAKDPWRGGGRLFRSADISNGTSPVEGAQYLSAGSYIFECTLHTGMEATLTVSSNGTPKARPKVAAAVLRQTLDRVRESGRLSVRLRSPTGARDVSLIARGAGAVIARGRGIDLGRGATRVVRLRVTRPGSAALAGRRSAKISLRARVPFGLPATAARRLGS